MPPEAAKIGILCWETGQVPKGLLQLETLVGNSTNPASYAYPVRLKPVRGANAKTILEQPDAAVLQTMIAGAQAMAADGIQAITTSCGFNAIFQRELAAAVSVPVFTSSLLQVPWVHRMLGFRGDIAILTASAAALRPDHLRAVGIDDDEGLRIFGLDACEEWQRIFSSPGEAVALDKIEQEVLATAAAAMTAHSGIRAFVLECTDLPPFSKAIRQHTRLPVFDFITLTNFVRAGLA